jgi:hypothetical protein
MILISVPDEDNQHHKDDQDMTELVINLLLSSSPYLIVTNPSISVILLLELEVFHIMEGAISSPSNTRFAHECFALPLDAAFARMNLECMYVLP